MLRKVCVKRRGRLLPRLRRGSRTKPSSAPQQKNPKEDNFKKVNKKLTKVRADARKLKVKGKEMTVEMEERQTVIAEKQEEIYGEYGYQKAYQNILGQFHLICEALGVDSGEDIETILERIGEMSEEVDQKKGLRKGEEVLIIEKDTSMAKHQFPSTDKPRVGTEKAEDDELLDSSSVAGAV